MEEHLSPLAVTHLLQHTLRSLCVHENSQWVYAVFWRILPRNYPPPKWDGQGAYDRSRGNRRNWILVWEDGFCNFAASTAEINSGDCPSSSVYGNCEFQHYQGLQPELFFKMSHEIYNYGEGLIGKVAADHSHKWIYKEPNDQEINFLSAWHNTADSQPRTWEAQFQSGIKTIALIAVREGVVQLGAVHKVIEDLSYVVLLRKKFSYIESIPGVLLPHPSSSAYPYKVDGYGTVSDTWHYQGSNIAPQSPTEFYDHFNQVPFKITPSMSSLEALLSKLPSVVPPPQPAAAHHQAAGYCDSQSHYVSSIQRGIEKVAKEEIDEEYTRADQQDVGESSSSLSAADYRKQQFQQFQATKEIIKKDEEKMTLGKTALARIPAIRCKIHSLFSAPHSSSSTNRTSPPLSRHMSMKSENLVSKLTSSGLLKTQGLIDGKWVDAHDGDTIEVLNPATGEVVAIVPCMGQSETNNAISSAYDAFRSWRKLTASERSQRIRKWYDLLIAHKEELGQLITLEQGKPLKEAMGEVSYGASFIEFYAEEAKRVYGDIIPATLGDRRLFVLKQPVGVVGAITPWNFPLAMITRKVGPALACGCTVVLKPSELTPLTALAAAELALQAGIPPGVLNVVMGKAPDIGDALLASHEVRKITFTGSTAVGKKLMAGAAGTVKRLSLELGGNAPCIVFDDADLDVAVKGSLAAKFRNSGQTCVCANRIIVQEGIYDKFADAFSKAVQSMQVGDGFSEGVTQGPLINEAAVQKVESFVQDAIFKGAKVLLGGKRHSLGMNFYEPTIISNVTEAMLLSREEVFGPVAPLLRFKTEEEAILMANNTKAGLAAYIFTNNVQRSWRVTEALEYGLVGVNEGLISTEVAPFGGVKQSGLGREGSKYGMDEYLEMKYVCLGDMNRK